MRMGEVAGSIGRGLEAGASGTAVMTISSTVEMKLRDRQGSSAPSAAAGKVLGVQTRNPQGAKRFSTVVHVAYGTDHASHRSPTGESRLAGAPAIALHFACVWGSALVMLPALNVAPPVKEWDLQSSG